MFCFCSWTCFLLVIHLTGESVAAAKQRIQALRQVKEFTQCLLECVVVVRLARACLCMCTRVRVWVCLFQMQDYCTKHTGDGGLPFSCMCMKPLFSCMCIKSSTHTCTHAHSHTRMHTYTSSYKHLRTQVVDVLTLLRPPHRASRPKRILVVLRGLPGSGKSFLAKKMRDVEVEEGGEPPRVHSLDDYFIAVRGCG
jgi:hypothetical protein